MKTHDGLKMILTFYDNHGALKQVADLTGVSKNKLQRFVCGQCELSPEDRYILENYKVIK